MRRVIEFALLASSAVAILFCTLRTGWFGDDASYANLPFAVETGRVSVASAAWASYTSWLETNGRWYPGLVVEKYAVFSIFQDRLAYKMFLIAISLAALASAWHLMRKLAGERFAFVSILGTIACFQIRGYHDPFLAYNGMIQVVAICLFLSLAAFDGYVESKGRRRLIVSLALYIVACTTYEISYVLAPTYVIVAYGRTSLRRSTSLASPFVLVGAGFVAASLVLRERARIDVSSMYALHLDPGAYLAALYDQTTAAIPLSYLIFDPSKIFAPAWHGFDVSVNIAVFAIAATSALAVIPSTRSHVRPRSIRVLAGIGASFMLLPAIEIPLLLKYQQELRPGLGYLPVFIEYFGVGIFIALPVARYVTSRTRRWVVALGFAIVASLSAAANEKLADILEKPYLSSRVSFAQALSRGLLATVPEGATLAIQPEFPWVCNDGECIDGLQTSDVVAGLAHKNVRIVRLGKSEFIASLEAGSPRWRLSR